MKIHATFNIFNEAQFIREAIESVAWCDSIIVVDGAYMGFPSKTPESTDGTREIILELAKKYYPKLVFLQMNKFAEGYEKIDAYMNYIQDDEYFIRMNGDEIFEGDSARLCTYIEKTDYLPLYQIPIYPDGKITKIEYVPKILRKFPGLKLTSRHVVLTNKFNPPYTYGDKPRGMVTPMEANTGYGMLRHMKDKRNPQRTKDNKEWLRYYYSHQHEAGII